MDAYVSGGEIQITMDLRDVEDLLVDLRYVTEDRELEPRTQDLVDMLYEKGIKG
jgi:hypothetical protein